MAASLLSSLTSVGSKRSKPSLYCQPDTTGIRLRWWYSSQNSSRIFCSDGARGVVYGQEVVRAGRDPESSPASRAVSQQPVLDLLRQGQWVIQATFRRSVNDAIVL